MRNTGKWWKQYTEPVSLFPGEKNATVNTYAYKQKTDIFITYGNDSQTLLLHTFLPLKKI
jgi:hypothetical protein